jgi:DNA-binding NarL/FixJ family response regulator
MSTCCEKLIDSGQLTYPRGPTARDVQVLSLAAKGRANKEISSTLFISEHTVARHLQNIFTFSSRTEATASAFKHSLV